MTLADAATNWNGRMRGENTGPATQPLSTYQIGSD